METSSRMIVEPDNLSTAEEYFPALEEYRARLDCKLVGGEAWLGSKSSGLITSFIASGLDANIAEPNQIRYCQFPKYMKSKNIV